MPELTVMPVANPKAELPPREPTHEGASLAMKVVMFLAILIPLAGVIASPFFVWGWSFRWTDLGLLLAMYLLKALGITVGFHRLFVHRSFDTFLWVKVIWGILGSMAVQGPLLKWVAMHRRHQQHSDLDSDPHTPHLAGAGLEPPVANQRGPGQGTEISLTVDVS